MSPGRAGVSGYEAVQNQTPQGLLLVALLVLSGWKSPVHHHKPLELWWELVWWQLSLHRGHNMMGLSMGMQQPWAGQGWGCWDWQQ